MRLVQLSRHNIAFPSPEGALREPNGLLALGGDLSPARLLMAYQRGIFPWFSPGDPILWWSPDPRAVLWPAQFHASRSMKRFHAKSPYRVTLNHAFGQVIEGCAEDRYEGTWITRDIITAYHQLQSLATPTPSRCGKAEHSSAACTAWRKARYFAASRCSLVRLTPRKPHCWSSARRLPSAVDA